MSRIVNAWRALMGAEPEADPLQQREEDAVAPAGVLFGLDPPRGHKFRVCLSKTGYWHVSILKNDRYVCGYCGLAGFEPDEKVIAEAAQGALDSYARQVALKERKARFEGSYPPKRTGSPE
ncbi:MAG TPA: hypothetical protein VIT62_10970 [Lysobacter sp.]